MRSGCAILALFPLVFGGCGYVHFGRLPAAPQGSDAATAAAFTNLATEHKILKQELALARKEGDTLRLALERAGGGTAQFNSTDLVARLNEAARELATLRANYARLQLERPVPAATTPADRTAAELEEKLASSLRNYTQLHEENAQLRTEVEHTRSVNVALNEKLAAAAKDAERTQETVAQLNLDLLAQKEARGRAEQASAAMRAQLNTVLAHRGDSPVVPAPTASTVPVATLQIAKAPPADSSPTAELRLDTGQLRQAKQAVSPAKAARVHVVQSGDTLEKLSQRYYGAPGRWQTIYDANAAKLSGGRPLLAGMELQIPEE